jgi:hypothetical protein
LKKIIYLKQHSTLKDKPQNPGRMKLDAVAGAKPSRCQSKAKQNRKMSGNLTEPSAKNIKQAK